MGGEQSVAPGRALEAGTAVAGRYRIEAQLGRGATGQVYRVRDQRNAGRPLALKRLDAAEHTRTALFAAQFEREYHTLCQLQHPRIIEVYDYGVDADAPFYT